MLDACPTCQSDSGELSQLIHFFSLIGLIEKNINLIDRKPSKIYLLTFYKNLNLSFKKENLTTQT